MRLFLPTLDRQSSSVRILSRVLTFASFLDQFLRFLLSSQQVGNTTRLKHFDLERHATDRREENSDDFSAESATIDK